MQDSTNVQENLEKLEYLKQRNPSATHVYMERDDHVTVDIPLAQAEFTIRQRPTWTLVSSNKQMDDEVAKLFEEPSEPVILEEPEVLEVPPKPSEKKRGRPKKTV